MVDYLGRIDNGLIIETPKIILPWSLQKREIFDKINSVQIVSENYYTIKVVLSGISFINKLGLHFEKDKLSAIDLFNDEKYSADSKIDNIFSNHQLILEDFFGPPSRNKLLDRIKDICKEYRWRFRYVTIIHSLWDRFGVEENLKIVINR